MGMVSPAQETARQNRAVCPATEYPERDPRRKFVEMPRIRENAFCCGAGRGTKEAFPDLAIFSAKHRLEEVKEVGAEVLVSACPWCKSNFGQAAKENGDNIRSWISPNSSCASLEG